MQQSFLILTLLFCGFFSFSQSDTATINSVVQDIRNELNTYKKIEKINGKQGSRFVFLKDKELKLITVKALEPNVEKNVEWYYANQQMVYTETNWFNAKTQKNIYIEKCYFNKTHLIAWINSQFKFVDSNSNEFKKMDTLLARYGKKINEDALK